MALRPPPSDKPSDKPDASADVLLREVDEAVRQQKMLDIARNYGVLIAGVVILGLLAANRRNGIRDIERYRAAKWGGR